MFHSANVTLVSLQKSTLDTEMNSSGQELNIGLIQKIIQLQLLAEL